MFKLFYAFLWIMYEATGSVPGTPQRISLNSSPKAIVSSSVSVPSATSLKRNSVKTSVQTFNKSDVIPVIVPRTSARSELAAESRKEASVAGRTMPFSSQSKTNDFRKFSNAREEVDRPTISIVSESIATKATELSTTVDRSGFSKTISSSQAIDSAERNMKDDRCVGPGKQETSSLMEPSASFQHESCMYLIFNPTLSTHSFPKRETFKIFSFLNYTS